MGLLLYHIISLDSTTVFIVLLVEVKVRVIFLGICCIVITCWYNGVPNFYKDVFQPILSLRVFYIVSAPLRLLQNYVILAEGFCTRI